MTSNRMHQLTKLDDGSLATTTGFGESNKWSFIDADDDLVYIESEQGQYLMDDASTLNFTDTRVERWTLEQVPNSDKVHLKSMRGEYLMENDTGIGLSTVSNG